MFIDTPDELHRFCERARGERVIAVDTEFLREKTFYPKLCLVQVATADEVVAIDPLAIADLAPLAALLTDDRIVKVFHACTQDLEVISSSMGCDCAPVFDTQLAAAFLGLRQQISLGALVEAYCDVHLPKADSLTDWSRRPLDADQLEYAEDDVRYLIGIYAKMMDELAEKGRLGWITPEMDALTAPERVRRSPEEAYLKLKRSSSLTRRQLAIAREIAAWRERAASKRDIPRKWVLSDELVVELSRRAPESQERLRRMRGTEQLSDRDAGNIVSAVKRGLAVPPADCPRIEHHPRPAAEVEGAIDLMYALLRVVSDKIGIAAPLIATRDDLAEFIARRDRSRLAESWRYEVLGRELDKLLAGELGLTVKGGRIEIL